MDIELHPTIYNFTTSKKQTTQALMCQQQCTTTLNNQEKWTKIIALKVYPSFINDSPSIIVLSFLLAPSSFSNATTATGSVALSSPPSNNDVFQSH